MHRQKRPWPAARQLEAAFVRCWLRLDLPQRARVVEELRQPFRRQWYIVDEHGVRRLRDDE